MVEGVALGNAYLPEGRRFIDEFVAPETSSYVETLEGVPAGTEPKRRTA